MLLEFCFILTNKPVSVSNLLGYCRVECTSSSCSTLTRRPAFAFLFSYSSSVSLFPGHTVSFHVESGSGNIVKQERGNAGEPIAENGVWVQALAASAGAREYHHRKKEIVYAKSCNLVHFDQKMVLSAVSNAFLNA